jgi:hypothetical protein
LKSPGGRGKRSPTGSRTSFSDRKLLFPGD